MMKMNVIKFGGAAAGGLLLLAAGCGGNHRTNYLFNRDEGVLAGAAPRFISGPPGVLLTNLQGFSARVSLEIPGQSNKVRTISGRVLGQGGRLFYVPDKADRSYIWNVGERGGFVLSEALQGYAPISSKLQITTNIDLAARGPAEERANGHACHVGDWVTETSDGARARYTIWRADDLKGFPVRIKAVEGETEFTLNLMELKVEALPEKLFQPPGDFTKYTSGEAMITELMVRETSARTKQREGELPDMGAPRPNPNALPPRY